MAGSSSTRGRVALALAVLGGAVLVGSALGSWVEPARVPWPSPADGVPDLISHPSDALFRIAAALLGVAAFALAALVHRGVLLRAAWLLLAALGLGGLAIGLAGLDAVSHDYGFGTRVANDMTLTGFRHGATNYVELAGASLLTLAAISSQIPPTSAAARADRGGTGSRTHRRPGGGRTSASGS